MRVVAEGVESAETLGRCSPVWGCDEAQGLYLGRPMPARELERWLRAPNPLSRARS